MAIYQIPEQLISTACLLNHSTHHIDKEILCQGNNYSERISEAQSRTVLMQMLKITSSVDFTELKKKFPSGINTYM
jgi:hypothetical protein